MASEKETDAQHFKLIPLTPEQLREIRYENIAEDLTEACKLLRAALVYDPMVDQYKLKELHKEFKKFLGD